MTAYQLAECIGGLRFPISTHDSEAGALLALVDECAASDHECDMSIEPIGPREQCGKTDA